MDETERRYDIERHVAMLNEHYDSVRILATRTNGNDVETFNFGGGNVMASLQMAHEWVIANDARVKRKATREC